MIRHDIGHPNIQVHTWSMIDFQWKLNNVRCRLWRDRYKWLNPAVLVHCAWLQELMNVEFESTSRWSWAVLFVSLSSKFHLGYEFCIWLPFATKFWRNKWLKDATNRSHNLKLIRDLWDMDFHAAVPETFFHFVPLIWSPWLESS